MTCSRRPASPSAHGRQPLALARSTPTPHMAAAVSPTRQGVLGITRTSRTLSPAASCRSGAGAAGRARRSCIGRRAGWAGGNGSLGTCDCTAAPCCLKSQRGSGSLSHSKSCLAPPQSCRHRLSHCWRPMRPSRHAMRCTSSADHTPQMACVAGRTTVCCVKSDSRPVGPAQAGGPTGRPIRNGGC